MIVRYCDFAAELSPPWSHQPGRCAALSPIHDSPRPAYRDAHCGGDHRVDCLVRIEAGDDAVADALPRAVCRDRRGIHRRSHCGLGLSDARDRSPDVHLARPRSQPAGSLLLHHYACRRRACAVRDDRHRHHGSDRQRSQSRHLGERSATFYSTCGCLLILLILMWIIPLILMRGDGMQRQAVAVARGFIRRSTRASWRFSRC